MNHEYRLALFKGAVTFFFAGIFGFAIEKWHSASQEKRDQNRILLETSYDQLENFGATLAFLRATAYRMPSIQSTTPENLSEYRSAYRKYSEAKVPFVIGMQKLGIEQHDLKVSFAKLNESAIKMDTCLLGSRNEPCNLTESFQIFVNQSTSFESKMLDALGDHGELYE